MFSCIYIIYEKVEISREQRKKNRKRDPGTGKSLVLASPWFKTP